MFNVIDDAKLREVLVDAIEHLGETARQVIADADGLTVTITIPAVSVSLKLSSPKRS